MEEVLPKIISDLALILMVAGLVTIVFKRLKQPLVLGYIVAGFLAGPHMPYTPTVGDHETLEVWSQIGVIFMMFALGLEFSFKKIVKMGMGPVISALMIMVCMMGVGSGVGKIFGWGNMDRLFLGGMLAMSSTTIIYKAFDDMGLRTKKFAEGVMSVLILEDILGILLMVVLSAMAVSQRFEGGELTFNLLKLGFFLLLWFVVGIYMVPLFLKKNSRFINAETLLIVSLGLCFAMVVLASNAGYSPAFGAFMMGSILAETVEAERIEKVVGSTKDLFGAIFFVSVGMLVDPSILIQYWLPILVITIAILLGQSIFGTMSFILSGQNLKGGIQSGFSMAQIGEFAFIIAGLGESLGVTNKFLYPVVVAVSIITTFLTPYMIKASVPAYKIFDKLLPERMKMAMERRSENEEIKELEKEENIHQIWRRLIAVLVRQTVVYMVITMAIIMINLPGVLLTCRSIFGHWVGNAVCGILTLVLISPFIRAIVMRKNHSSEFHYLSKKSNFHLTLLIGTVFIRFLLACNAVYYVFNYLSPFKWYYHIVASMLVVVLMCMNKRVKLTSIRIERTFRQNLVRREVVSAQRGDMAYARRLQSHDLHIARLTLPDNSSWGGKSLMELQIGGQDNVLIASILRGSYRINIPDGHTLLFPRDIIEVVGDDTSIEMLSLRMQSEVEPMDDEAGKLHLRPITLDANSPYLGKMLKDTDIRNDLNCMVIGFEEEDGSLSIPSASRVFQRGDKIWLVSNTTK